MKTRKTVLKIAGMHCPSCEILIEDKFKSLNNVLKVKANHKTQTAEVFLKGKLDKEKINQQLQKFGYQIKEDDKNNEKEKVFLANKIVIFISWIVFWIFVYLMIKEISFFNRIRLGDGFQFWPILILGLIASVSTCMATSGALFLATLEEGKSNLKKALYFNTGRIVAYGFFGFGVGLIGKELLNNFYFSIFLNFFIALLLIFLGLDMAKIIPLSSIFPYHKTRGVFRKLENLLIRNRQHSEFLLGGLTYFLPCGFTQTTQVYALGLANPWLSAATMMVFALGTSPAIFLVASIEKFLRNSLYHLFFKAIAALVFLVGIYYFFNSLALAGINFNFYLHDFSQLKNVRLENNWQIIEMVVDGRGYTPNEFVVKKNQPVRWIVKGKNVYGCQGYFVVPELGIRKVLEEGDNFFEFTPKKTKPIYFSCGMGMYRGVIEVIE